ncbi:MAG: hypothetical protein IT531_10705 [Burkholderiales bacterium]|nr:hypothetical protein [Burkholderiales bacterium]
MNVLLDLSARLIDELGEQLASPPQLAHDALLVRLDNGVALELRFTPAGEYSIGWSHGDTSMRIDTAPVHPELATYPNHLHGRDGTARADPLTDPQRSPWENLRAVIEHVRADPLLREL